MRVSEANPAHVANEIGWDSIISEAETELYRATVVLYRWRESDKEWADIGPGKLILLERKNPETNHVVHQLVFRNTGTFKTRSNHVVLPGECGISKDFPAGVEVLVAEDLALRGLGSPGQKARLCFSFEEEISGAADKLGKLAQEFLERYKLSQEFTVSASAKQGKRGLPTLAELVKQKKVLPGKDALLYVGEDGKEHVAEVTGDGRILLGTKLFKTPSGYVYHLRATQSQGKYTPLDNGWLLVEYNKTKLQQLRMGPGLAVKEEEE